MPSKTHLLKNIGIVILGLVLIGVVAGVSVHRVSTGSSDFDTYYYAGKSILAGEAIYTISRQAVNQSKSPFVYPPFFACLISILSFLPISVAASIWNVLNLFFFVGSLFLMHQMLMGNQNFSAWFQKGHQVWFVLLSTLLVLILIDNLAMAQVNLFVFFLVLLALRSFREEKEIPSGIWLGIATAIKLIPAIFFFYFLIQKKWRVFAGGFIAFVLCVWLFPALVVGHERNLNYLKSWYEETIKDHGNPHTLGFYASQLNPSHQNLQAVIFRLVIDWEFRERTGGPNGKKFEYRTPLRLNEDGSTWIASAVCGILFLVLCFVLVRARSQSKTSNTFALLMSCLFCAMVLLSPKARSHFFIFICFPWAVLLKMLITEKNVKETQVGKAIFSMSALLYLLQGFKYFKFLGTGSFSILTLFLYFASQFLKPMQKTAPEKS